MEIQNIISSVKGSAHKHLHRWGFVFYRDVQTPWPSRGDHALAVIQAGPSVLAGTDR